MILLYKGRSAMSRLIRWFAWADYSHAAWKMRDGTIIEAWQFAGVRRVEIGAQHKDKTPVDVFQVDLTLQQRDQVEAFLIAQLGKRYDWWGILGFLRRKKLAQNNRWFCSELVMAALQEAGILPLARIPPYKVSPGLLAYSPLLRPAGSLLTCRPPKPKMRP